MCSFYELADTHLTYGAVRGNACAAVGCHVEKYLNWPVLLQNGFLNHLKVKRIMIFCY
jgi:hypothetical protein